MPLQRPGRCVIIRTDNFQTVRGGQPTDRKIRKAGIEMSNRGKNESYGWDKRRWQAILLIAVAVLCLVACIVLFVTAGKVAGYKRVFSVICGVLMAALSVLFLVYWWLTRDVVQNYFLYDRRKKMNIPVERLEFGTVNERMNNFLALITRSFDHVWSEEVLENEEFLKYPNVYRPLVAYKMLYDLGDVESDQGKKNLENYENASEDVIRLICQLLEQVGEKGFVQAFRMIREKDGRTSQTMLTFLEKNRGYISSRMLAYVKRNIERFYAVSPKGRNGQSYSWRDLSSYT